MTSNAVAILAFHAVEDGPGPLCLPPAVFERQVKTLHGAGCVALTMTEVADRLVSGEPFPDRAVALTFDDGYASVHSGALSVLDAVGWRATVYPVTGELGGHNRWDAARPGGRQMALVDRDQLLDLVAAGWEVGGHTHTHRSLPTLDHDAAAAELDTSTAILEDLLQRPLPTFAYPFGDHDPAVRELAGHRYRASLTIGAKRARVGDPLDRVERVESWYLRRTWQLERLGTRSGDAYLLARRLARAVRQLAPRRDRVEAG